MCDDEGDFFTLVPKKMEVKLTDLMKSPFVTEFGSSMEVSKKKKEYYVSKNLIPFSLNIVEPLKFDRQTKFDLWIKVGLKKKNKYVMGMFSIFCLFGLFGFFCKIYTLFYL